MRWVSAMCCALLLALAGTAQAQRYPDGLQLVGTARLEVLWFHIYDAALLSASGQYRVDERPLLLVLDYRRNISRDKLLQETRRQLEGRIDTKLLSAGLARLSQLLPDIRQGEQLAFYLDGEGAGRLYHDRRYLGALGPAEFDRAFLDIWLAHDSAFPELARRLRGETQCEIC